MLRVAAASAPSSPASSRSRRTSAAQTDPAESARKSASVYTAFRKKAVGKNARLSVAARAARSP
jgi:hypothetical protein